MTLDDDTSQADEQPADSDQPAEQSDDKPADDQPAEPSDDKPADDQPAEPSDDKPADDQPAQQSDDKPADDQPAQQSDDKPADQPAEQSGELSAGRQNMLDLINTWMPTSLNSPMIPDGETQDLMAKAGWTKAQGVQSKADKDAGKPVTTSCGDILATMLRLWKSNFVGAFMIRDLDSKGKAPGAKGRGFYVEADGSQTPKPGDIIVLRSGFGKGTAGTVGHVGILVEATDTEWRTADGGGGTLPDQTASVTTRTVRLDDNNIPILKSPTDGREKQLDGWVDLDKLEQTG